ncbi:hypothetical protein H0H92_005081 [Tricholoma furcatifolium]|nr:hypothetical protein H0H92_005081 [Tricholoma furcatifolium]
MTLSSSISSPTIHSYPHTLEESHVSTSPHDISTEPVHAMQGVDLVQQRIGDVVNMVLRIVIVASYVTNNKDDFKVLAEKACALVYSVFEYYRARSVDWGYEISPEIVGTILDNFSGMLTQLLEFAKLHCSNEDTTPLTVASDSTVLGFHARLKTFSDVFGFNLSVSQMNDSLRQSVIADSTLEREVILNAPIRSPVLPSAPLTLPFSPTVLPISIPPDFPYARALARAVLIHSPISYPKLSTSHAGVERHCVRSPASYSSPQLRPRTSSAPLSRILDSAHHESVTSLLPPGPDLHATQYHLEGTALIHAASRPIRQGSPPPPPLPPRPRTRPLTPAVVIWQSSGHTEPPPLIDSGSRTLPTEAEGSALFAPVPFPTVQVPFSPPPVPSCTSSSAPAPPLEANLYDRNTERARSFDLFAPNQVPTPLPPRTCSLPSANSAQSRWNATPGPHLVQADVEGATLFNPAPVTSPLPNPPRLYSPSPANPTHQSIGNILAPTPQTFQAQFGGPATSNPVFTTSQTTPHPLLHSTYSLPRAPLAVLDSPHQFPYSTDSWINPAEASIDPRSTSQPGGFLVSPTSVDSAVATPRALVPTFRYGGSVMPSPAGYHLFSPFGNFPSGAAETSNNNHGSPQFIHQTFSFVNHHHHYFNNNHITSNSGNSTTSHSGNTTTSKFSDSFNDKSIQVVGAVRHAYTAFRGRFGSGPSRSR